MGFVAECLQVKENSPLNLIKSPPFKNAGELPNYIHDFLQELEREPIPVYLDNSNHGAVTRDGIVANGIFPAPYNPVTTWQSLADNLAELLKGNGTLAFETYFNSRISSIAPDETNTVVTMNDNWKTGSAAPVHGIQAIQNYSSSLPFQLTLMSKYEVSMVFDWESWGFPTTHGVHPRYDSGYHGFQKIETAQPILILSTNIRPSQPPEIRQTGLPQLRRRGNPRVEAIRALQYKHTSCLCSEIFAAVLSRRVVTGRRCIVSEVLCHVLITGRVLIQVFGAR